MLHFKLDDDSLAAKAYLVIVMLIRKDASRLMATRNTTQDRSNDDSNQASDKCPSARSFVCTGCTVPATVRLIIRHTILFMEPARTYSGSSEDDDDTTNNDSDENQISDNSNA